MPMDGRHDTGYAHLFSQPRMVQDLLRGFLPEEWVGWLDPATLERRDGGCHPERESPLIWRLRWQGGSDWIYLLLRPQGEPDPFTALRLELDRGLLYHALLRRRRGISARLPAVLPVVLYNGETRWTAPLDARELFLPLVPALQRHVPSTRYLLLDVAGGPGPPGRRGGEPRLAPLRIRAEPDGRGGRPPAAPPLQASRGRGRRAAAPGLERLPRLLVPPPPLPRPLRGHGSGRCVSVRTSRRSLSCGTSSLPKASGFPVRRATSPVSAPGPSRPVFPRTGGSTSWPATSRWT